MYDSKLITIFELYNKNSVSSDNHQLNQEMSRGNVFKLSGNMALGSSNSISNPYSYQNSYGTSNQNSYMDQKNGFSKGNTPSSAQQDVNQIKNSLRLLKSKQQGQGQGKGQGRSKYDDGIVNQGGNGYNDRRTDYTYGNREIDNNNNYNGGYNGGIPKSQQLNRNKNYYGGYDADTNSIPNNNRRPTYTNTNTNGNRNDNYGHEYEYGNKYHQEQKNTGGEFGYGGNNKHGKGIGSQHVNSSKSNQRVSDTYSNQYSYNNDNPKPTRDTNVYNNHNDYQNQKASSQTSKLPVSKNRRQQEPPSNPTYPQSYNQKQERSIKQVNKQNHVDIIQYDPSNFIECRQGCGRKFNPNSLVKHESICKKVFQKKRKEFDAQAHRIVEKQQVKLMKKGEQIDKKIESQKAKTKGTLKMAKWKAQSLQFRAVLKQNQKGGELSQKDKKLLQQSKEVEQAGMVKCPYCGRSFNESAGPRHITFCEGQQKKLGINKGKKK